MSLHLFTVSHRRRHCLQHMMNRDQPDRVSVIIPVFNMETYVGACIDSVLENTFNAVEVIVVDDGSTDHTARVVKQYTTEEHEQYDSRVVYVRQKHAGKPQAVNRGFSLAQGDYLTVVDADDQIPPRSISSRYKAIRQKEGASHDLAIGAVEMFGPHCPPETRRLPDTRCPERLHDQFWWMGTTPFHTNACLFSKSLYEQVGPYDPCFSRCEDIDYSIRLLNIVDEIAWVDKPVYRYRKRRSCLERARIRTDTLVERISVYWKNYTGWRRYAAALTGATFDAGKFFYELTGRYKS